MIQYDDKKPNAILKLSILTANRRYCYREATQIYTGQRINLIGKFDQEGLCVLDNNNDHLMVTDSDCLVSGTSISTATKCLRR